MKKLTKLELAKKLCNYNNITNKSRIFSVDEFTGKYSSLKLGNGGDWCRRSNLKNHKLATMKNNGEISFLWNDVDNDEIKYITNEFNKKMKSDINKSSNKNFIKYFKFFGLQKENIKSRSIRKEIKKYYQYKPCCVCGSKSNIIIDHKNDLYNDIRVLNTKTQRFDDFQSLCIHCNLQKRQINKQTRVSKKRYGATNIPMLSIFNIDFISGNENIDFNDVDAMKGTFWYDPVEFMKHIYNQLI